MSLDFSEQQNEIQSLARTILEKEVSPKVLRGLENDHVLMHRPLWHALGEAKLLGMGVPEMKGGAGFSEVELGILLEEQGRVAAPIPLLSSLGGVAGFINRFGEGALPEKWLPKLCSGQSIGCIGVSCWADAPPEELRFQDGKLSGRLVAVKDGGIADCILCPVCEQGALNWYLVEVGCRGISRVLQKTTDGQSSACYLFESVLIDDGDLVFRDDTARFSWDYLRSRMLALGACLQVGLSEAQLALTASYATEREQFGKPIGSFQAVAQRAGDCYIDLEGMRLTAFQAVWRLSVGESFLREALIARYFGCEGGHNVSAAAQHIHGGMGADRDYPLFRYCLWTRQLEMSYGGANQILYSLGNLVSVES